MIYRFNPINRPTIWGSEIWVLSGYPDRLSKVADGEYAGMSIAELIALKKGELVGESVFAQFGSEFPMLIKFIDAHTDLSIQVHPDEKLANERHNGHGKTEMWYIIRTEGDAHLYSGLSREITPQEYQERVENDSIVEVLADHKVAPGDVFFLPAGRIHAICGGNYLAEIQQTSDITYRIYDYGRLGDDGKPRELHTELAKDAIDYKVYDNYKTDYEHVENKEMQLVKCPYFTTSLYDLTEPVCQDLSALDSFLVVMCLEGAGTVGGHDFKAGEVLLVDARTESVDFVPEGGGMKLLTSHI